MKIDDGYGLFEGENSAKGLYMVGVLTIVNRGLMEINKEDPISR